MSLVVPLRALRPARAFASQVAAPPYDVLNVAEARRLIRDNPLSFLRVEKSEVDLTDAGGVEDERIYVRARTNLADLVRQGVMVREPAAAFYLYRQRLGRQVQTGIVAGVSVAEYEAGRIRRHELTRADKERERTLHIDAVGAQTGLVFLAYRGREAIDRLVAELVAGPPEIDFTAADGVSHTVWVIADPARIGEIRAAFAAVEALYIADGHHRAAAATAVARLRQGRNPVGRGDGPCQFILAVLFPQDQLRIMDYNRAVRDLRGLTAETFLARVGERFTVTPDFAAKAPGAPRRFGMYLAGRWYELDARREILRQDDPIAGLDVSLLQDNLLGPLLGIGDPRTDERIEFVGGIRGMAALERLVDQEGFAVAFSLYPPTLAQMLAVADAGRVMPPKSTWFEPKLLSGLFVHLLD
jgi:uncharacterized protein (DUF1015 family)